MEVKQTGFHDLKIFVIKCLCYGEEKKTFEIDPTLRLSRKYAPYFSKKSIFGTLTMYDFHDSTTDTLKF